MVEVYNCGTKVKLSIESEGIIIGIQICNNGVSYNVGYWLNGEYKTVWLYEYEFSLLEGAKTSIGFKA